MRTNQVTWDRCRQAQRPICLNSSKLATIFRVFISGLGVSSAGSLRWSLNKVMSAVFATPRPSGELQRDILVVVEYSHFHRTSVLTVTMPRTCH